MGRRKKAREGPAPSAELRINEKYAEDLERRKRREELHRAKSLGIDLDTTGGDPDEDGDESSSESEDEAAMLLTKKIDRQIHQTIEAIRRKDERVYDSSVRFFEGTNDLPTGDGENREEEEEEVDEDDEPVAGWDAVEALQSKDPTMTLKDYVRTQALTTGAVGGSSSSSESEDGQDEDENRKKARQRSDARLYDREQRELKKSLEDARREEDGEDDGDSDDADEFFVKKRRTAEEQEAEQQEFDRFVKERSRKLGAQKGEEYLLHSYMEKENSDGKERFLMDFVMNNGWLDRNKSAPPEASAYEIEVDGDEDESFLAQQDAAEHRHNFRFEEELGDKLISHGRTVEGSVRRTDADRRKRQRELKAARKEAKKAEMDAEVRRLKNAKKAEIRHQLDYLRTTSGGIDFGDFDLDADYDPDEFSKKMEEKFGDDFYDWQNADAEHPFEQDKRNNEEAEGEDEEKRKEVQNLVTDYYNIGYEDVEGEDELKFSYKSVEPADYDLTIEEILTMDDKDLNQRVPLKRLAPYRRGKFKKRNWLKEQEEKQKQKEDRASKDANERRNGAGKGTGANHSSSRNRREKMAVKKMSASRAKAYGVTS